MPGRKKTGKTTKPGIDQLPELLERAFDRQDDVIVTFEKDPDSAAGTIHIISGKFVTACMLRKLMGQAEAQRDEGSSVVSVRRA